MLFVLLLQHWYYAKNIRGVILAYRREESKTHTRTHTHTHTHTQREREVRSRGMRKKEKGGWRKDTKGDKEKIQREMEKR